MSLDSVVLLARSKPEGWVILHAFFQGTNPLAQPFAQFRQFLGTENQQRNGKNDDQVRRLKQDPQASEPPKETLRRLLYTVPEG